MVDYNVCCRLCLQESNAFLNCLKVPKVLAAINLVFGIVIAATDDCSTKICKECITKISQFSMYRDYVINNQKTIKNYQNFRKELFDKTDEDDDVVFVSEEENTLFENNAKKRKLSTEDSLNENFVKNSIVPDAAVNTINTLKNKNINTDKNSNGPSSLFEYHDSWIKQFKENSNAFMNPIKNLIKKDCHSLVNSLGYNTAENKETTKNVDKNCQSTEHASKISESIDANFNSPIETENLDWNKSSKFVIIVKQVKDVPKTLNSTAIIQNLNPASMNQSYNQKPPLSYKVVNKQNVSNSSSKTLHEVKSQPLASQNLTFSICLNLNSNELQIVINKQNKPVHLDSISSWQLAFIRKCLLTKTNKAKLTSAMQLYQMNEQTKATLKKLNVDHLFPKLL